MEFTKVSTTLDLTGEKKQKRLNGELDWKYVAGNFADRSQY